MFTATEMNSQNNNISKLISFWENMAGTTIEENISKKKNCVKTEKKDKKLFKAPELQKINIKTNNFTNKLPIKNIKSEHKDDMKTKKFLELQKFFEKLKIKPTGVKKEYEKEQNKEDKINITFENIPLEKSNTETMVIKEEKIVDSGAEYKNSEQRMVVWKEIQTENFPPIIQESTLEPRHEEEVKSTDTSVSLESSSHETLETIDYSQTIVNLNPETKIDLSQTILDIKIETKSNPENVKVAEVKAPAIKEETEKPQSTKIMFLAVHNLDMTDSIKEENEYLARAFKENPKLVKVRGRRKGKVSFLLPLVYADVLYEGKDIVHE